MDRVEYQSLIIQDIINLKRSDELNLSPWYQRRSVWSNSQKSYLINTILEQKPIPAIYVRHSIDLEKGKSMREVVDGQQRTRTIIEYSDGEFAARHPEHARKVKFNQLSRAQQQKFLMTSIPVGYLLGASDYDVIDIFGRINSVSKTLNAQEKRNAAYSGEMKQFCLHQAANRVSFWRNYNIFSSNDIARMIEIQFVSDVVYNILHGLSDFSNQEIDNMYGKYDEDFPLAENVEARLNRVFNFIVGLDPDVVKETIFARQPLFFSLIIALDSLDTLSATVVERALREIDSRFVTMENRMLADVQFYNASNSTTQRIAQRTVRHHYIIHYLTNA
ncbi:DUF262 domain-containing protein [Fundidesulfovibrio terrae]|uniref:DUF262 domain-containing protein n=1 Tax=Fundidesulfovibrio terrae TaxID=2922866 RepID=UPI001FB0414A|nr:DUF262 domain-containing protein [Fundidesulfovibrio terrae]